MDLFQSPGSHRFRIFVTGLLAQVRSWAPFQAVGEQLHREGRHGVLYRSAA
jgi:hypothetical protein